ncbi:VOC family protein [Synechococcus elongatus IITB7]|uniref:VOC family protein n=1 Tax=Synechococcus elongatus TaxID=32046 RepID=UPI0030CDD331
MRLASTVIYVSDVPKAMQFYTKAFGFEVNFLDPDVKFPGRIPGRQYQFGELKIPGGTVQFGTPALGALLMPGFPEASVSTSVELAFYTDDVASVFNQAIQIGGEALRYPEAMPWGQTVAYLRSPEGTYIAICTSPVINNAES